MFPSSAKKSSVEPMLGSQTGDDLHHAYADRAADCILRDIEEYLSSLPNLRHSGPVVIGCLGSIITTAIQNALRDPEVGCHHPVVYTGTCLACQETIGELFGDRFDYLEQGLRLSRVARETLRKMVSRRFLGVRKLHLVLDLDHTLLQSIFSWGLNPDWQHLKTHAERYDVPEITGDLFIDDKDEWITKLRPFVRSFLKEASAMFELTVYTKACRSYAKDMVGLLDPGRSYFGNRVIAMEDSARPASKSLDPVLSEPSCTLILDDDSKVWPDHTSNLILAERYNYFADKHRTHCRDLRPKKPGEHDDGDYLSNVLSVLKSVHRRYFNLYDSRDRGSADVRSQLATTRGDVLKDCQILIFAGASSTMETTMQMARELGAVIHSRRCSSITHVISEKTTAIHSRWALEQNKFLVHPDWVSASYLIQLGKTKLLNILNDDGVGILNVEAALHNIGANENPDLTMSELLHSVLKLL